MQTSLCKLFSDGLIYWLSQSLVPFTAKLKGVLRITYYTFLFQVRPFWEFWTLKVTNNTAIGSNSMIFNYAGHMTQYLFLTYDFWKNNDHGIFVVKVNSDKKNT